MANDSIDPLVKLHRAFGYYIAESHWLSGKNHTLENGIVVDNIITIPENKEQQRLYLATTGKFQLLDTVTNEVVHTSEAGDSTLNNPAPVGTWKENFIEDQTVFCLWKDPVETNPNGTIDLTKISQFTLGDGQPTTITTGTKLFLACGALSIDGQDYQGPRQLAITSGDKTAMAKGDCYGFIFG